MNKSNLINEGFFDKIKSFLTSRPKLKGKEKINYLNKIKLALKVSKLNKSIDDFSLRNNLSNTPSDKMFSLLIYDFLFDIKFS